MDKPPPPEKGTEQRSASARAAPAVPPVRVFSQLGVRLPADLANRLRAFSARSGQSLNAIVASALERYLTEKDGAGPLA